MPRPPRDREVPSARADRLSESHSDLSLISVVGCGRRGPQPGTVQDEAMRAGIDAGTFRP